MRVLALKVGYVIVHALERIPFISIPGVLVVLRYESRVLLVRHAYGNDGWQLPGGLRPWLKSPLVQIREEIGQELGIVPPELALLGTAKVGAKTIHIFTGELTGFRFPKKGVEIAEVGFFQLHELSKLQPLNTGVAEALLRIGWEIKN